VSTPASQPSAQRSPRSLARILSIVGFTSAVIFIVGMWANLPAVQLITKGIPVLCLIAWLWMLPRDRFANLIMAGLIFSVAGDLVLQISKDLFVPGLLLFLVAHLLYIAAFLGVTRRGSWVRLLPFAAWGVIAFLILQPYLGNMLLPVAGYIIVIEVMMWRAVAMVGAQGKTRDFELATMLGAIAFGLSDTLLALNRFIWHDTLTMFSITEAAPFIPTLTITLYWLAQCGLALSAGWETKDQARQLSRAGS
jgi:alkenylglycerophosphocholine/alkenylglycerophosphoethanolamine hydrolase